MEPGDPSPSSNSPTLNLINSRAQINKTMSLITVYRTFSSGDAHLVCSRLEAANLQASVAHELSALSMDGYALAAGGIRVQVPEEQADEARQIIESRDQPEAEQGESGNGESK